MKQQIGITMVIFLSLFAGSYMVFGHGDEKHDEIETSGGSKYPIVTVIKAKQAYVDTTSFEVNGVVHAKNQSEIYPLKSGNVTQLLAETGDYVQKGQVLARITPERSDIQIGSDISLLQKEISILKTQKTLVAKNTDKRIELLSQTNADKKTLLINNKDRKNLDTTNKILPIQTQIESRKLEAETAKKQYEVDIQTIDAQISTARSQQDTRQLGITNSVIDMIDATADFLYNDSFQIKNFRPASRKIIRSELIGVTGNEVYKLSESFLSFHAEYRNSTLSQADLANQALRFSQEARQISNTVSISVSEGTELSDRLQALDEAIDHYNEVQLGNSEILNRIQDLETQKITKKLELEQKGREIQQLVTNLETQIIAQNKGIDINIDVENQTLDTQLKITTQELELETILSQREIDTQIANRQAKIEALQGQRGWGTTIKAPFSGAITAKHVSVGTSVDISKPLFSMVDESSKFIRFYIGEDQYPFIREGKQVSFSSPFSPSESFQVAISRVSKSLSQDTKQILVEADITGRDDLERVITNMNVRVQIPLFSETDNGDDISLYAIPESAIELSENSSSIWFIDDSLQSKTKRIETDFFFNGTAYVKGGLDGSEWIIIASPVPLSEGLEIDTKLVSNDEK